jgi:hypothetical protein
LPRRSACAPSRCPQAIQSKLQITRCIPIYRRLGSSWIFCLQTPSAPHKLLQFHVSAEARHLRDHLGLTPNQPFDGDPDAQIFREH